MDGKQRMFRVNEFVGCRFASVAWRQPHSVFYAFVADLLSIYGTEELKQKTPRHSQVAGFQINVQIRMTTVLTFFGQKESHRRMC